MNTPIYSGGPLIPEGNMGQPVKVSDIAAFNKFTKEAGLRETIIGAKILQAPQNYVTFQLGDKIVVYGKEDIQKAAFKNALMNQGLDVVDGALNLSSEDPMAAEKTNLLLLRHQNELIEGLATLIALHEKEEGNAESDEKVSDSIKKEASEAEKAVTKTLISDLNSELKGGKTLKALLQEFQEKPTYKDGINLLLHTKIVQKYAQALSPLQASQLKEFIDETYFTKVGVGVISIPNFKGLGLEGPQLIIGGKKSDDIIQKFFKDIILTPSADSQTERKSISDTKSAAAAQPASITRRMSLSTSGGSGAISRTMPSYGDEKEEASVSRRKSGEEGPTQQEVDNAKARAAKAQKEFTAELTKFRSSPEYTKKSSEALALHAEVRAKAAALLPAGAVGMLIKDIVTKQNAIDSIHTLELLSDKEFAELPTILLSYGVTKEDIESFQARVQKVCEEYLTLIAGFEKDTSKKLGAHIKDAEEAPSQHHPLGIKDKEFWNKIKDKSARLGNNFDAGVKVAPVIADAQLKRDIITAPTKLPFTIGPEAYPENLRRLQEAADLAGKNYSHLQMEQTRVANSAVSPAAGSAASDHKWTLETPTGHIGQRILYTIAWVFANVLRALGGVAGGYLSTEIEKAYNKKFPQYKESSFYLKMQSAERVKLYKTPDELILKSFDHAIPGTYFHRSGEKIEIDPKKIPTALARHKLEIVKELIKNDQNAVLRGAYELMASAITKAGGTPNKLADYLDHMHTARIKPEQLLSSMLSELESQKQSPEWKKIVEQWKNDVKYDQLIKASSSKLDLNYAADVLTREAGSSAQEIRKATKGHVSNIDTLLENSPMYLAILSKYDDPKIGSDEYEELKAYITSNPTSMSFLNTDPQYKQGMVNRLDGLVNRIKESGEKNVPAQSLERMEAGIFDEISDIRQQRIERQTHLIKDASARLAVIERTAQMLSGSAVSKQLALRRRFEAESFTSAIDKYIHTFSKGIGTEGSAAYFRQFVLTQHGDTYFNRESPTELWKIVDPQGRIRYENGKNRPDTLEGKIWEKVPGTEVLQHLIDYSTKADFVHGLIDRNSTVPEAAIKKLDNCLDNYMQALRIGIERLKGKPEETNALMSMEAALKNCEKGREHLKEQLVLLKNVSTGLQEPLYKERQKAVEKQWNEFFTKNRDIESWASNGSLNSEEADLLYSNMTKLSGWVTNLRMNAEQILQKVSPDNQTTIKQKIREIDRRLSILYSFLKNNKLARARPQEHATDLNQEAKSELEKVYLQKDKELEQNIKKFHIKIINNKDLHQSVLGEIIFIPLAKAKALSDKPLLTPQAKQSTAAPSIDVKSAHAGSVSDVPVQKKVMGDIGELIIGLQHLRKEAVANKDSSAKILEIDREIARLISFMETDTDALHDELDKKFDASYMQALTAPASAIVLSPETLKAMEFTKDRLHNLKLSFDHQLSVIRKENASTSIQEPYSDVDQASDLSGLETIISGLSKGQQQHINPSFAPFSSEFEQLNSNLQELNKLEASNKNTLDEISKKKFKAGGLSKVSDEYAEKLTSDLKTIQALKEDIALRQKHVLNRSKEVIRHGLNLSIAAGTTTEGLLESRSSVEQDIYSIETWKARADKKLAISRFSTLSELDRILDTMSAASKANVSGTIAPLRAEIERLDLEAAQVDNLIKALAQENKLLKDPTALKQNEALLAGFEKDLEVILANRKEALKEIKGVLTDENRRLYLESGPYFRQKANIAIACELAGADYLKLKFNLNVNVPSDFHNLLQLKLKMLEGTSTPQDEKTFHDLVARNQSQWNDFESFYAKQLTMGTDNSSEPNYTKILHGLVDLEIARMHKQTAAQKVPVKRQGAASGQNKESLYAQSKFGEAIVDDVKAQDASITQIDRKSEMDRSTAISVPTAAANRTLQASARKDALQQTKVSSSLIFRRAQENAAISFSNAYLEAVKTGGKIYQRLDDQDKYCASKTPVQGWKEIVNQQGITAQMLKIGNDFQRGLHNLDDSKKFAESLQIFKSSIIGDERSDDLASNLDKLVISNQNREFVQQLLKSEKAKIPLFKRVENGNISYLASREVPQLSTLERGKVLIGASAPWILATRWETLNEMANLINKELNLPNIEGSDPLALELSEMSDDITFMYLDPLQNKITVQDSESLEVLLGKIIDRNDTTKALRFREQWIKAKLESEVKTKASTESQDTTRKDLLYPTDSENIDAGLKYIEEYLKEPIEYSTLTQLESALNKMIALQSFLKKVGIDNDIIREKFRDKWVKEKYDKEASHPSIQLSELPLYDSKGVKLHPNTPENIDAGLKYIEDYLKTTAKYSTPTMLEDELKKMMAFQSFLNRVKTDDEVVSQKISEFSRQLDIRNGSLRADAPHILENFEKAFAEELRDYERSEFALKFCHNTESGKFEFMPQYAASKKGFRSVDLKTLLEHLKKPFPIIINPGDLKENEPNVLGRILPRSRDIATYKMIQSALHDKKLTDADKTLLQTHLSILKDKLLQASTPDLPLLGADQIFELESEVENGIASLNKNLKALQAIPGALSLQAVQNLPEDVSKEIPSLLAQMQALKKIYDLHLTQNGRPAQVPNLKGKITSLTNSITFVSSLLSTRKLLAESSIINPKEALSIQIDEKVAAQMKPKPEIPPPPPEDISRTPSLDRSESEKNYGALPRTVSDATDLLGSDLVDVEMSMLSSPFDISTPPTDPSALLTDTTTNENLKDSATGLPPVGTEHSEKDEKSDT